MAYGYGYSYGVSRRALAAAIATAPDYEEPIGDDPIEPPAGEPEPPTDTPTDPDNDNEPEPGFDDSYVAPDRIEITDGKQSVVRTDTDPGTWGNAYVASPLTGPEYWEVEVASSTPNNATLAIGVSTLAMPLNGIPGALAGTIAYWSDGTVRQNGATLATLATYGRRDRIGVSYDADGGVRFFKNCVALNSGAIVGSVTGSPRYPFVGLYSANSRTAFKFALSKFGCTLPDGFYPIGQVPPPPAQTVFFEDFTSPQMFESGAALRHIQTSSNSRRAVSFDTAPNASDQEVLAALVLSNPVERWGVILRGGGAASTETAYVIQGSSTLTGAAFGLARYVSGTLTVFDHVTGPKHVAGRRVWLRARIEGTALKFKVWMRGEPEPDWQAEITDSGIAGPGYAGLFSFDSAGGGKYCEYFGVGNGGASAPRPDETLGANQYATDFSAASALDAWTQRWASTNTTLSRVTTATDIPPLGFQVSWDALTDKLPADAWSVSSENLRLTARGDSGASYLRFASLTAVGLVADADAAVRVTQSSPTGRQAYIVMRGSGSEASKSGYLFAFADGGTTVQIYKITGNSFTSLASVAFSMAADTDYFMRFRVVGSDLFGKVWAATGSEPASWTLTATNSDIAAPGILGVGRLSSGATQATVTTTDWRFVSVETNGGAAPLTDPNA